MKEVYVIRLDKPLISKSLRKNRKYLAYFNEENLIVINDNNEQVKIENVNLIKKNNKLNIIRIIINNKELNFQVLEIIDTRLQKLSNNNVLLRTKYVVYAKRNSNYNNFNIQQKDLLIIYLDENVPNSLKQKIKIYKDNKVKTLDYKPEAFKEKFDIVWKEENVKYNQINKNKNVSINNNNKTFTIRIPYQLYTNSKFRNYYNKINTNGNKFNSIVKIISSPNNQYSALEIKLEPKINNGKIVVTERDNKNININNIEEELNKALNNIKSGKVYNRTVVNTSNKVKNKFLSSNKNNITYENKIKKAITILNGLGFKLNNKTGASQVFTLKQLTNEKLTRLINNKYNSIYAERINSESSPENFEKNKQTRNKEKNAELNNLKALIESIKKNKNLQANLYSTHPNQSLLSNINNPMIKKK